jgi:hypothetical protein
MLSAPMLKKQAIAVHGGQLGNPSKMPGKATGLDPRTCGVGSKLRDKEGSTCENCYAFSGNYSRYHKTLAQAWTKRRKGIDHPNWVQAMVTLLKNETHFRWHDAGDVQGWKHLVRIMAVAAMTPNTKHWLPTREYGLIARYRRANGFEPVNMTIRLSAPMVGALMNHRAGLSSMVLSTRQDTPDGVHRCPASTQNGSCGNCRACWDRAVPVVGYPIH